MDDGAGRTSRRGCSHQRRQYGVNTRKWSPPTGARSPGGDDRDARECLELDPRAGSAAQPPLALLRVGADVLAHEDRTRIRLEREPDGLADDVPAPDDDCPAPRPQRRAQIAERVEQEGDAVRRSEGREHRIVQDEKGNDPLRPFHGRGERRLVVQAQVAREQHHHRPAFAHLDKG